jgi:hypothetical protein
MPFKKGHAKTGGRKKGSPYRKFPKEVKRDPKLMQKLQEFLDDGLRVTPLDAMLGVLKIRIEEGDYDGALVAAEKAAPYCHAKLAMSEVRVQHSTDRSDSEIAADIAVLRAKLDAARSLPARLPVTIDVPLEPAKDEPVTVDIDSDAAGPSPPTGQRSPSGPRSAR